MRNFPTYLGPAKDPTKPNMETTSGRPELFEQDQLYMNQHGRKSRISSNLAATDHFEVGHRSTVK